MENFLARFRMDVRKQFVYYMYCIRLIDSYKKSYNSLYNNFRLSDNNRKFTSSLELNFNHHHQTAQLEKQEDKRATIGRYDSILKVPKLILWYEKWATYSSTLVLIKFLLPLESIITYLFDPKQMPAKCYIPGRVFLFYSPELRSSVGPIAFILALSHMNWRWIQKGRFRPYTSNVVTFLLEDDEAIRQQYEMISGGYNPMNYNLEFHEIYLRNIMSYPVQLEGRYIRYKLRANRSLEARSILIDKLNRDSIIVWILFIGMMIVIIVPLQLIGLTDIWYINNYPGCAPEMEKYYNDDAKGQMGLWSFTSNRHRLLMMIFDFYESIPVLLDSLTAITFLLGYAYIINYDLILCWRLMNDRLELLMDELKWNWLIEREMLDVTGNNRAKHCFKLTNFDYSQSKLDSDSLVDRINDIQMEICDCFKQIGSADMLISEVITSAILFWFISFIIIGYYSNFMNFSYIIRFAQSYGFMTITLISYNLMSLHKSTKKSYGIICSCMAYDKSKYKRQFIKVLEFYIGYKHSAYTILHQYPFVPNTYLTIVGWTFSCATIARNLVR